MVGQMSNLHDNLVDATHKLAQAIKRASEEHGRPNTFGAGELETLYGGPSATLAGKVGANLDRRYALWQCLGGRDGWGSCPTYSGGRFAV